MLPAILPAVCLSATKTPESGPLPLLLAVALLLSVVFLVGVSLSFRPERRPVLLPAPGRVLVVVHGNGQATGQRDGTDPVRSHVSSLSWSPTR